MTTVVVIGIFAGLALLTAGLLFFEALREKNRELEWRVREFDGGREFNPRWEMSEGSYRVMDCRGYEVEGDDDGS